MTEEKRGRKSKEELKGLPNVSDLPLPMPAPDTLNDAGRERWRQIVNEHGADRFRKSDRVLLEQLIRSEQLAADMEQNIELNGAIIGEGRNGRPVENPACKILNRTVAQMMSLHVKLKLCPSTRYRADSGSLQHPKKSKKRPWE